MRMKTKQKTLNEVNRREKKLKVNCEVDRKRWIIKTVDLFGTDFDARFRS